MEFSAVALRVFNLGIWLAVLQIKFVISFDNLWQEVKPVTQHLINSYISMCEAKGKSFDNMDMEDELNDCVASNLDRIMNPILLNNGENPMKIVKAMSDLKNANDLSLEQVGLIGKNVVEPVCQLLPALLICSKPYQYPLIKSCSPNPAAEKIVLDYIEIVIYASCKYNGHRIIDFLAAGGIRCSSLISNGRACFQNITSAEMLLVQAKDICRLLGDAHDCLAKRFERCAGQASLRILNSVLGDVRSWVSNMCSRSRIPIPTKKVEFTDTDSQKLTISSLSINPKRASILLNTIIVAIFYLF